MEQALFYKEFFKATKLLTKKKRVKMVNFMLHIFNHEKKNPYKIKPAPLYFSLTFKAHSNFISAFFASCSWDVKMFFLLFFITTPPSSSLLTPTWNALYVTSLSSIAFDAAHSCLLHEAFLTSCRESLVKQGALCVYVNMCVRVQSLQSCLTL